ncbi:MULTISPECIES: YbjQ family protein [unclassified Lacrimispora]|uniref:YbjQ family protein n=1 Tax=unclassified Lacrimispora TaxID=2719232 RepID=UPI003770137E
MILCCTTCGNSFNSDIDNNKCDYCGNETVVLITDEELKSIPKSEIALLSNTLKEKYKSNPKYNSDVWEARVSRDNYIITKEQNINLNNNISNHKLTTGFDFDGYKITKYIAVISGNVVLGTGLFSEFVGSISDVLGTTSTPFENKMEKAKEIAIEKLIIKSATIGGNAILGVDFDFFTLSNNMIAVSANGTSVIIEEVSIQHVPQNN